MKTDEMPGNYEVEEDDELGMAMVGQGYDGPSVIVEAPRKTTQRQGRRMVETEEPAWVRFSTSFKNEIAEMPAHALKVFIYIGLSIGFQTGKARPGVRNIAEKTGMDKSTVLASLEYLEKEGFMEVFRQDGKTNEYKPVSYFGIGTVRPDRTVDEELSGKNGELSGNSEKPSGQSTVKMHNNINNNNNIPVWKYREAFPEKCHELADLCVLKFGPPSKKDTILWVKEIGSWVDLGLTKADWNRALDIVSTYTTQPGSPGGMTRAMKIAHQERANAHVRPEHQPFKPHEGNFVKKPAGMKPNIAGAKNG